MKLINAEESWQPLLLSAVHELFVHYVYVDLLLVD